MIVYKATNLINGKSYIGVTRNSFKSRQSQHRASAKKPKHAFGKAIKKYGWDAFCWEILDKTRDLQELGELETMYIKEYDTYKNGYNETYGGEGTEHKPPENKAFFQEHPYKQFREFLIDNEKAVQDFMVYEMEKSWQIRKNPEKVFQITNSLYSKYERSINIVLDNMERIKDMKNLVCEG